MRLFALLTVFGVRCFELSAQPQADPVALVVSLMSGEFAPLPENAIQVLESAPWEALAYADTATLAKVGGVDAERLQEAVPDVYHFSAGVLSLKPFNPDPSANPNGPIEVFYRQSGRHIILSAEPGGEEIDRWGVHYLDSHYLILDFGDLRLFLSHP